MDAGKPKVTKGGIVCTIAVSDTCSGQHPATLTARGQIGHAHLRPRSTRRELLGAGLSAPSPERPQAGVGTPAAALGTWFDTCPGRAATKFTNIYQYLADIRPSWIRT